LHGTIVGDLQFGFYPGKSTTDMIFALGTGKNGRSLLCFCRLL